MRREGVSGLEDLLTMLVFHSNDLGQILTDLKDSVLPTIRDNAPELYEQGAIKEPWNAITRARDAVENLIQEIKSLPKE